MYTDPPIITLRHPDEDHAGDTPCFPEGEGQARVALVEHPDPLCRARGFIALQRGEREHAYELCDFQEQSVVERALGWAGIGGATTRRARVRRARDYHASIPSLTFDVPADIDPSLLAAALTPILLGEVPGAYGVAHSQVAFTTPHDAFQRLRSLAGDPPIKSRKLGYFGAPAEATLIAASVLSPGIFAARTPTDGSAAQRFGAETPTKIAAAGATVKRLLLDVPLINQNVAFTWTEAIAGMPRGGSLCGVATLRMYLMYFNTGDISEAEQSEIIDRVYITGKGMAGGNAPAVIREKLGAYWQIGASYTTTGSVADVVRCLDRRYPVPVGVLAVDGTIELVGQSSWKYQISAGDPHPRGPGHPYGNAGHWLLAVGYEKRIESSGAEQVTAILVNDPDTGARVRVPVPDAFAATAGSDGDVWMITTQHQR
jgi:hypothetical protein